MDLRALSSCPGFPKNLVNNAFPYFILYFPGGFDKIEYLYMENFLVYCVLFKCSLYILSPKLYVNTFTMKIEYLDAHCRQEASYTPIHEIFSTIDNSKLLSQVKKDQYFLLLFRCNACVLFTARVGCLQYFGYAFIFPSPISEEHILRIFSLQVHES